MLHLPKPLLSANIYCDRHLDEVVALVLAPFWHRVAETLPSSLSYLWFIRYARRGEHIKLRLHAPEEQRMALQRQLEEVTHALFASLPAGETQEERINNTTLPPIDDEDAGDEACPDRTILWTSYRPSAITVGSETLLPDERLLALFTRSLAAGTEVVLAGLTPSEQGEYTWRMRQNLVIKLVLSTLNGLPFSPAQVLEYLTYHRDWLIRYMLYRGRSEGTADELIARFDARVREMPAAVDTIRGVLASQLTSEDRDGDDVYARLSLRMAALYEYIVRFRSDPGPALDPYAPDQVYLPIFKCLHGLSNQVGLGMPKEAQIYHLLVHAAAGLQCVTAAAGEDRGVSVPAPDQVRR